ncbi:MAG: ribonuclease D, partial [Myxococcota bacterium]
MNEWVEHCADARVIAVDTESDSFHHYREKVCLIQMTARGVDAIVDPLALESLQPLGELFSDPTRIKIFHDAGYDLICLRRDFEFRMQGVFDTMLASRLLGERSFGLAAILKQRFGHESNKRLQRSDWTRRPLSEVQISYARYDTHFLPELTKILTAELKEAGRWAWAEEEFSRLPEVAERLATRKSGPNRDDFWRIRGIRTLSPDVLGRVRELYLERERIAKRLDRPPFKVFGDAVLVDLAQ